MGPLVKESGEMFRSVIRLLSALSYALSAIAKSVLRRTVPGLVDDVFVDHICFTFALFGGWTSIVVLATVVTMVCVCVVGGIWRAVAFVVRIVIAAVSWLSVALFSIIFGALTMAWIVGILWIVVHHEELMHM
jgi:hypothetical protein